MDRYQYFFLIFFSFVGTIYLILLLRLLPLQARHLHHPHLTLHIDRRECHLRKRFRQFFHYHYLFYHLFVKYRTVCLRQHLFSHPVLLFLLQQVFLLGAHLVQLIHLALSHQSYFLQYLRTRLLVFHSSYLVITDGRVC